MQLFTTFEYDPLLVVAWAGGIILFFVLAVFFIKPRRDFIKALFFIPLSFITVVATSYLVLETMRQINISPTKGPVHWHADFKIFRCGEEIDLVDPKSFSNRVGTPLVHEHGDKRVHIEGIPEDLGAASLKNFMYAVGGYMSEDTLRISTNMGSMEMKNGNLCRESAGTLQVFVWTTDNNIATQRKLELFSDYTISPHALVPPGDCIIVEFDIPKEQTEYICEQYSVAENRGDISIEY
ncbi:MAG: hypothetical protein Q8R36_00410 [bacterium]|nr:hypothetical protein [bacterium]